MPSPLLNAIAEAFRPRAPEDLRREELEDFLLHRVSRHHLQRIYSQDPTKEMPGGRLRKTFKLQDDYDWSEEAHDVEFMDEEEQEKLIHTLIQQDVDRNRYYSRVLSLITALSLPYFVIRCLLNPSWFDIASIISIVVSWLTLPVPNTEGPGIKYPGRRWINAQLANCILSFLPMLYVWFPKFAFAYARLISFWYPNFLPEILNERPPTWAPDTELLILLPWSIAIIGWAARKLMDAINFEDLHHKRYNYKGA